MKNISERRELVNELFIVFALLTVITISSYTVVSFLTNEQVTSYLKSISFLI